jgi:HAD superfamily hydrolase (TIGR01509 family)
MALDAVLFDIDGTLLDTNPAHVEAWHRAFLAHDYHVARDRIEVEIGKGGDKLVPSVLGKEADERHGEQLRRRQTEEFGRIVRAQGLKPLPGALELLAALRKRKLQLAVATSAKKKNLRVMEESAGLQFASLVDVIVSADDCHQSKPAPDVVVTAVEKLGMSPAQCALIGDTSFDMRAAKLAGVVGLAVLTGFQSRQRLLRNGARAVYEDTAEVLAQLDQALRVASPSALHITQELLTALMREALVEAQKGCDAGELPIGCVIADGSGKIIGRGHNQAAALRDSTAHAEMLAFRSCAGKIPSGARDHMLVSTLEPCVMCTGAAMESAIDTVVYGLRAPANSGTGRVTPPESPESQMPRIIPAILPEESRALLQRFQQTESTPRQRAFVAQLLALTR